MLGRCVREGGAGGLAPTLRQGATGSVILLVEDPEAGVAGAAGGALDRDRGGEVEVEVDLVVAVAVGGELGVDVLGDIGAGAELGGAGVGGGDVEIAEPERAAQAPRQPARAAPREGGDRAHQLGRLEGRHGGEAAPEEELGEDFLLREVGGGGEADRGVGGETFEDDVDGHVIGFGAGDEAQVGVERAAQVDQAFGEVEALGEDVHPAADQLERAAGVDVGGGAAEADGAAQFGVEAAAAHEDLVGRVDHEVEGEGGGGAAAAAGLDHAGAAAGAVDRSGFVDVTQIGDGAGGGAAAGGHLDLGAA